MVSFRYSSVICVQEQVLLILCAERAPELNIARPSLSSARFVGARSTSNEAVMQTCRRFFPRCFSEYFSCFLHMYMSMRVGAGEGEGVCMYTSWIHGTFKTTMFSEVAKKGQSGITLPRSVEFCLKSTPHWGQHKHIFTLPLHCLGSFLQFRDAQDPALCVHITLRGLSLACRSIPPDAAAVSACWDHARCQP